MDRLVMTTDIDKCPQIKPWMRAIRKAAEETGCSLKTMWGTQLGVPQAELVVQGTPSHLFSFQLELWGIGVD
jgi:hypothetical protein